MKYVLLVSHGTLAAGMHETLNSFFVGKRDDLLHVCLEPGMGIDDYVEHVKETVKDIRKDDEIIVLADIICGSPLVFASYALADQGLLDNTTYIAGMNLTLALNAIQKKDTMKTELLAEKILTLSKSNLMLFNFANGDDRHEEIELAEAI